MPPKVKNTKEAIISTALELVRAEGESGLNARSVAKSMGCSTQPLYFNFESMENLKEEVCKSAEAIHQDFLHKELEKGKYSEYEARQIAYIRFANKEKNLFKLLFMNDQVSSADSAEFLTKNTEILQEEMGISKTDAFFLHLELWSCVHGIATMIATDHLTWDGKIISRMLSDIQEGLLSKYAPEE